MNNFNYFTHNKLFIYYALFLILILLFTNNYWTFNQSVDKGFSDFLYYIKISKCGEDISFKSLNEITIPEHFAERWVPVFFIGVLSKITNIDILVLDRFFILVVFIFIVFILYNSTYNLYSKICYLSIIVLNPYTFRSYMVAGYNINECLFLFSVFLLVFYLNNGRLFYLLIAILLGVISRQTTIFFIPILFIFYYKRIIAKKVLYYCLAFLFFLALILKLSIFYFFKPMPSSTLMHLYGLFIFLFKSTKINESYIFISRILLFLILLTPLLLLNYKNLKLYVASAMLLSFQPILAGPIITGGAGLRLYAFSLPFLCYPLLQQNQNLKQTIFFIIIVFILSLHHNYSFINSRDLYFIIILLYLLSFIFVKLFKIIKGAKLIK